MSTTSLGVALAAAGLALASPAAAQLMLNSPGGPTSVGVISYRDIPFRTVVRQRYDFSCGSAALATLLRYHYGRDVTEQQVFEAMFAVGDEAQIRKVGFSLLDMKRYLEAHGYASDGFRMTLEQLAAGKAPAIVMVDHAGYRHFVVLKGIDEERVLIGDPASGLKIYSREQFSRMWNGVAFMVRDPADRFNSATDWRPWATASTDALPADSLAAFTRELPPIYQVTATFSLNTYLR